MARIEVVVSQGSWYHEPDRAALSLAVALNKFLAGIEEVNVRRVETHHFERNGACLFLAFIWLNAEEEEEDDPNYHGEEEEDEESLNYQLAHDYMQQGFHD